MMSARPQLADELVQHSEMVLCANSRREHLQQTPVRRSLFDDLVGAGEQHRRDREAKRLGCLEIDYEIKFGRDLHR
jgi:hypothetical protein